MSDNSELHVPVVGSDDEESCHHDGAERKSHHSDKVKSSLISRLNRIEGQVRGIKGLIERDTYCDDVLNQIASEYLVRELASI